MIDRFAQCFDRRQANGATALMAFITAGDPDRETSRRLIESLPAAGADIVEIGVPSADPVLDGPVIKASHARAVAAGATPHTALDLAAGVRRANPDVPLLLMGYAPDLRRFGARLFLSGAREAGADGVLVVEATAIETAAWRADALRNGLAWIPIAPPDDPAALDIPGWAKRGFIYSVASPGATGGTPPSVAAMAKGIGRLRERLDLPVVAGFGIRTAAMAQAVGGFADGIAVGTAIVKAIGDNLDSQGKPMPGLADALAETVKGIAAGVGGRRLTAVSGARIRGQR
ncbi:MAG: tryptophan synthase subunit alpha [Bauldia litoralis]